jgi:hypothetical protein
MAPVFEVVDPTRELPPNFNPKVEHFYKCLPDFLLPQKPSNGKLSFTLNDLDNRCVEIQLDTKALYVKKRFAQDEGESRPSLKTLGPKGTYKDSPTVSCNLLGSIDAAWEKALGKLGGWRV